MSGYYYGFDETGCESVDVLLSAVACAGKAFHHTEEWNNESDHPDLEPYEECHRGKTPEAWIQNAAVDAAQAFKDAVEKARAEGEAAGREAERRDVVAWLDGVGTQYMQGDMVPCDEFTGEAYHQAKGEIERGEHETTAEKERGNG